MKRPVIRNQQTAVLLGLLFFGLGSACLYDAWEGRGGRTPALLRPVTWW